MGNDVDGTNEVIIHKYAFHMIISLTRKLAKGIAVGIALDRIMYTHKYSQV